MSLPRIRRSSSLALGALAVASLAVAVSLKGAPERTPFVPQAPPQLAIGDFDGDGRIDTALIQNHSGTRQISVQLSGSVSAIRLEAPVTGVVQGDIDHDGDLDLVAATSDGDFLIWLNDGHGHFVPKPRASGQGFLGEPLVAQATWPEPMAISLRVLAVPAPTRDEMGVAVTRIRPPTACLAVDLRRSILPALRAPPIALA